MRSVVAAPATCAVHRIFLSAFCLCAAGLVLPAPSLAQQGQTATLSGTVTDSSGALLPGVTLTISSPSLIGGARQTNTGADGQYRFTSLAPGVYEVTIARQGFRTVRHLAFELPPGLGVTLDARLSVAPLTETVEVTAPAPVLDVHASSAPTVIDREFIDNLPLDRSVIGFANLAPGVTQFTAFGGSMSGNLFLLDGTNGTEPGWGTPTATPNANWLDGIQVVALGANAEYGEFTGASVNAITRSGSNRFSGLSEYWTTRTNWTGNNRGSLTPALAARFSPVQVLELWDTTNQIGGPLVRDRLWFFGGMEYYRYARRPAAFTSAPRTPDEPQSLTQEPKLIAKLTSAPTRSSRLEGYFAYGNSKADNQNAGPLIHRESLMSSQSPNEMANVRFTWPVNEHTLVEARYGDYSRHFTNGPTPPGSTLGPPSHFDSLTRVSSVNAPNFRDTEQRTDATAFMVTRAVDRFAFGSHTFKGGLEYERARLTDVQGWTGGAQYYDFNGAPDLLVLWDGATYRPEQHRTSLFVQDQWRVSGPLTIEVGMRIGLYDSSLPVERLSLYENSSISPRLGVAWDVASDHRTVVRAHYGRYHDPLVTSFYDFLDPLSQTPKIVFQADASGQYQEVTRYATTAMYSIDPRVKHSYAEEYFVGIERELRNRLSLRTQYVHRRFKDTLGFIDTGTTWTPAGVTDPGVDGRLGTTDDGLPMTVYYQSNPDDANLVLTNPNGAYRHYNAFQVIGTGRNVVGVHVEASYTWSLTRGNFNNEFSSNAANNDMSVNGDWVNPNRALFSDGRTTRDSTHDAQVLGTYSLPYWGGVRASVVYRYTSGRPWARAANFGPLTALGVVRVEPIGAHEYPATNNVDLRVEKTLRVGSAMVGLFANVFNLTNQGIPLNVSNVSGPNFGLPLSWIDPRRARVGARLTF